MAKQLLLTRTELGERLGLSPASVTSHLQSDFKLAKSGEDLCDFNHESIIRYCRKRHFKKKKFPLHPLDDTLTDLPMAANETFRMSSNEVEAALGDAKEYMDLTLRQLVERHGTVASLKDWLTAVKLLLDIEAKDLNNNTTSGEYIRRDFVKSHVLGLVETMNVRLLNDSPKSIVSEVLVRIKAGANREQLEEVIRGILSQDIQSVKEKARRNLAK